MMMMTRLSSMLTIRWTGSMLSGSSLELKAGRGGCERRIASLSRSGGRAPVRSRGLGLSGCGSLPGSSKTIWPRNCEATGHTRHPGSSGAAPGG
jgi:hypothetical protein